MLFSAQNRTGERKAVFRAVARNEGFVGIETAATEMTKPPRPPPLPPPKKTAPQLALWFNLLETASASVRAGDALSAYLWLVTESNRAVGWLQGAVGVAQLVAALPAGWAADHPRCRRDSVLKGAAALGLLSAFAFGSALVFNRNSMVELFIAVALLGAWKGAATPPFESIFADSVATGASAPYTAKYALSMVAAAAGPLLSCFLFQAMGNAWDAGSCRAVLLAGLAAMLPPLAVACAFDDDASLGRRSEARDSASMTPAASAASGLSRMRSGASTTTTVTATATAEGTPQRTRRRRRQGRGGSAGRRRSRSDVLGGSSDDDEAAALNGDSDDDIRRIAAGSPPSALASPAPSTALVPPPPNSSFFDPAALSSSLQHQQQQQQAAAEDRIRLFSPSTWPLGAVVAALITLSDLIGALASGMTLKFFSLFFLQACDLSPVAVSLVGTAAPLGVAAASVLAGSLARRHGGRLHLSLLTRAVDVGLLVLLARLPTNKGKLGEAGSSGDLSASAAGVPMTAAATAAVIAVHLLRMASANATRPLVRAMLMENVPKRHRGKVNALDSVRTFSWSGSAALGGEVSRFDFFDLFCLKGKRERNGERKEITNSPFPLFFPQKNSPPAHRPLRLWGHLCRHGRHKGRGDAAADPFDLPAPRGREAAHRQVVLRRRRRRNSRRFFL